MVDGTTEHEGAEDESTEYGGDGHLTADHYAGEIAYAAQHSDYETLFGRLVEGVAAHGVSDLADALSRIGAWADIEQLADADLHHFLGWYDWCDASSQELLGHDATLVRHLAELRANRASTQEHGEYRDVELGSNRPEELAEYATAYLVGGEVANFFAYLASLPSGDLVLAAHALLRDARGVAALDGAAQRDPDGFLAALNATTSDVRNAVRQHPTIDALVQRRRRAERWQPGSEDLGFISGSNQLAVKNLPDRGSTTWVAGGFVILIGGDHDPEHVQRVNAETDRAEGQVSVRKGGMFGAGTLTFTGVPANKRELVKSAVARFSDKTVKFD